MKFCKNCGKPISPDIKFCKNCGNEINKIDINKPQNIESSDSENIRNLDSNSFFKAEEEISKPKVMDYTKNNEAVVRKSKKNNKNFLSGVFPKVIIGVFLILAILVGVFFNRIKGEYYMSKSNSALNGMDKIDYATKAAKAFDSTKSKNLLKKTIVDIAENDVDLAEKKLEEISAILSQGDYKNIASDIKEKKIDDLCNESNYSDALKEFNEIDKLGGDFKANNNYDDIMLNTISKLAGTSLRSNKNFLMESDSIYYENLDDDSFDEIVQLESKSSYYANSSQIKMNLYKYKDGKYNLVDSKSINSAYSGKLEGIYAYDTDKKGIFVNYENMKEGFAISVFGVGDSKLGLKGTIFGNNYTKVEDADNDGIYEIISNSTSLVTSSSEDVSKCYKVYEDGRTPTEVNIDKSNTTTTTTPNNASDYILKESSNTYITDEDIKSLSKDELALCRNEIYARHGYVFNEEKFKSYFANKSWYAPNPSYDGTDSTLNEYEIANYKLIQAWEEK
ncbi:YARHG domain-containing protein [Clostridium vincentii]|uniref:YARHG domain-containing protein n=1 Tax=Clostridium vincentii TaxID=52704 RepID=A0A2T0BI82_9CLOT|nr:YARHG domain-containing protein [Clostridium vincentii]PRR83584.1 hypothetical protein CLVI_08340 [Clostridium vincentii]